MQPTDYPTPIADLLQPSRLAPLDPGTPNTAARELLRSFDFQTAIAPGAIRDHDMADACLAGLWLYHDFLDESHTLSQAIATPTGSYWHGLMHRREPDFSNAGYWFRRVGHHPIFDDLRQTAATMAADHDEDAARSLLQSSSWDPFAFIDLCRDAYHGKGGEMLCRQIQQREWELLFAYCYNKAVG